MAVGRYALPLERPLTVGPASVSRREGALLRSSDGRLADLCPLPGLSRATLDEELERLANGASPLPALSWALHALEAFPVTATDLGTPTPVATATLVDASRLQPILHEPRVIKVKVGRGTLDEELAAVRALATAGHTLRLDGNRRLTPAAAEALADAAGQRLAFLEEPVAAADLPHVADRLPVALDETLLEISDPGTFPPAVAWVLKPTLLGAERTLQLVRNAQQARTPVIVSSCFESAVGRRALASAAAHWAPNEAHGLGTASWFRADFDQGSALEQVRFSDDALGAA